MTQEIDCVLLQLELLEHVSHGGSGDVDILPCLGVVEVDILHVEIEVSASLLLEETHQWRFECLCIISWHLVDDCLCTTENTSLLVLIHV
jgi:hypothetical protein